MAVSLFHSIYRWFYRKIRRRRRGRRDDVLIDQSVDPAEEATETLTVNNNSTDQELVKIHQPTTQQEVTKTVTSSVNKKSQSSSSKKSVKDKNGFCDKKNLTDTEKLCKTSEVVPNTRGIHTGIDRIVVTPVEEIKSEIPDLKQSSLQCSSEDLKSVKSDCHQLSVTDNPLYCVESNFVESSVEVSADVLPLNYHSVTVVSDFKKTERVNIQSEQASKLQEVIPQQQSSEYFRVEKHTVTQRTSDINIAETMETVDTFASEQIDIDSVEISDEIDTEALNALVGQLTGQTQRETTPDEEDEDEEAGSDTGSMQASTGSEGLEEQLNAKLDISDNADNKSNGETTKKEQSTKTEQKSGTKEKSKEEKSSKSKKKEDKTIDHILRALSSLQSTEEKLAALCKKYADLHEEHRVLQSTFKQSQRKLTVVTREKDQLQTEHTKAVMAKSKLESLCRELQKHNQVIRQESLQRAREEDEKRKEISNKFQTAIGEIQQQMQDHHDRNMKLREENQELAGKLKQFIEQYETREKQVEKVMQHRELEQKLADAKLQQANAILQEEQERSKKEKELLFLQASEGQKKATLLEAQLGMYKESYEEFQSTINKSNDMFQKFKTDMDKMSKKVKKLEKEGAAWKSKWEKSNKALIEMAEDKTKSDQERQLLMNKIQKLESLCRAMQAERLGRKVIEAQGLDPSKLEGIVPSSMPPSEHLPATNVPSQAVGGAGAEGDAQGGETQTCPADSTTKDTTENCDCPNDLAESDQSDGSQGSEAANETSSDDTSNKAGGAVVTEEESKPNPTEGSDNSQT